MLHTSFTVFAVKLAVLLAVFAVQASWRSFYFWDHFVPKLPKLFRFLFRHGLDMFFFRFMNNEVTNGVGKPF